MITISKFKGMLLFDVADEPIGNWQEDLGYRGVYDIWRLMKNGKDTGQFIQIEPIDDICEHCDSLGKDCECEEVWIGDDKTGFHDTLGCFESYDEAIAFAKKYMKKNPNGFV